MKTLRLALLAAILAAAGCSLGPQPDLPSIGKEASGGSAVGAVDGGYGGGSPCETATGSAGAGGLGGALPCSTSTAPTNEEP